MNVAPVPVTQSHYRNNVLLLREKLKSTSQRFLDLLDLELLDHSEDSNGILNSSITNSCNYQL